MDVDALKQQVCDEVDRLAGELIETSHQIHAHPELCDEERFAHDLLTSVIDRHGVAVARHAHGLDTAFDATIGDSGPTVALICEYDALPGVGHACGHNIIAAASLGAGLALARVAGTAGGRARIIGTPAEEGGGGKVRMARAGAFEGLAAAMMIHPADADLVRMDTIAVEQAVVTFHGKAAHAAAAPHDGRNALDAAVLGYMGAAALRQHILPNERIHGVFTNGGDKANVVPAEAAMHWMARSATLASLQPLKQRLMACFEGAAAACGCTVDYSWSDVPYSDMLDSGPLVAAYIANAARTGRTPQDPDAIGTRVVGSTDMGNVSYLTPSIHPMIKVAPDGVAIHTAEFAQWAVADPGDRAVLDGAKALAMTAIDVWTDPELRRRADDALRDGAGQGAAGSPPGGTVRP